MEFKKQATENILRKSIFGWVNMNYGVICKSADNIKCTDEYGNKILKFDCQKSSDEFNISCEINTNCNITDNVAFTATYLDLLFLCNLS